MKAIINSNIKNTVIEIACSIVGDSVSLQGENLEKSLLHIILSESIQAIGFVSLIEDEFGIEFDDEEIDLDFFSGFDHISELVKTHLNEKKQ